MSETVWLFESIDTVGCGEGGWIALFKDKPTIEELKGCFPLYDGQDESEFPNAVVLSELLEEGQSIGGWSVSWYLTEEVLK